MKYLPILSKAKLFIPLEHYPIFNFLQASILSFEKTINSTPRRTFVISFDGTVEGSFINENYSKIN